MVFCYHYCTRFSIRWCPMFNTTNNNNNNQTFKVAIITDDILVITCPIPRCLSLDKNWHTKEGGKEKTGRMALNLPSLTFPWSLARPHRSFMYHAHLLAKLCKKRTAWGGGWVITLLTPFAPEPPVTARADPDPFYPLWRLSFNGQGQLSSLTCAEWRDLWTIPEWVQFSQGRPRNKQKTTWHWPENLHENLVALPTYLSFHLILRS